MQNFTIPMNLIKASIHCAAVKDIRSYLNGAFFEYKAAEKRLRVISTNGSIMSCFSVEYPECEDLDFSIIIPIETLKYAAKLKTPAVTLHHELTGYSLGGLLFKEIEAKYPDYRRVIPTTVSGVASNYQPEYLMDAQNAMRDFYKSKKETFKFEQNGMGGAIVHNGHSDAIVIVTPISIYKGEEKIYSNFI